jgi:hypothetical protein
MAGRRRFDQLAAANDGRLKHPFSFGDSWDAKHVGGVVVTCLAIALRGLLVATTAVGMVAYLLLTRSHI